ncbi:hypothetical protein [Paraliomyxa miuraensis]|uniref:hypothetical protein n=2 Tax=Paraliomyxa miuraensis TaxID=376150 RepID=UPI00225A6316|nr:hypothetical protein [Paraliomyxa miuraensis]MCX4239437.1 hypothetical protein [Paraliomyxa miuraensis]
MTTESTVEPTTNTADDTKPAEIVVRYRYSHGVVLMGKPFPHREVNAARPRWRWLSRLRRWGIPRTRERLLSIEEVEEYAEGLRAAGVPNVRVDYKEPRPEDVHDLGEVETLGGPALGRTGRLDEAGASFDPSKPVTATDLGRWMPRSYRNAMALVEGVRGRHMQQGDAGREDEDEDPYARALRDAGLHVPKPETVGQRIARERARRQQEQVNRRIDARALTEVRRWAASLGPVDPGRFNATYRQLYPVVNAEHRQRALVLTHEDHRIVATVRGPHGSEFTVSRPEGTDERVVIAALLYRIEVEIPRGAARPKAEVDDPTPKEAQDEHEPNTDTDPPAQGADAHATTAGAAESEDSADMARLIELLTMVLGEQKPKAADAAPGVDDQEDGDTVEEERLAGEPVDAEDHNHADGPAELDEVDKARVVEDLMRLIRGGPKSEATAGVDDQEDVETVEEERLAGEPMAAGERTFEHGPAEPEAVVDKARVVEDLMRLIRGGPKREATDATAGVDDQDDVDAIEEEHLVGEPVDAGERTIEVPSPEPETVASVLEELTRLVEAIEEGRLADEPVDASAEPEAAVDVVRLIEELTRMVEAFEEGRLTGEPVDDRERTIEDASTEAEAVVDAAGAVEELMRLVRGGRKPEATGATTGPEDQEDIEAVEEERRAGEPVGAEERTSEDGWAEPEAVVDAAGAVEELMRLVRGGRKPEATGATTGPEDQEDIEAVEEERRAGEPVGAEERTSEDGWAEPEAVVDAAGAVEELMRTVRGVRKPEATAGVEDQDDPDAIEGRLASEPVDDGERTIEDGRAKPEPREEALAAGPAEGTGVHVPSEPSPPLLDVSEPDPELLERAGHGSSRPPQDTSAQPLTQASGEPRASLAENEPPRTAGGLASPPGTSPHRPPTRHAPIVCRAGPRRAHQARVRDLGLVHQAQARPPTRPQGGAQAQRGRSPPSPREHAPMGPRSRGPPPDQRQ